VALLRSAVGTADKILRSWRIFRREHYEIFTTVLNTRTNPRKPVLKGHGVKCL